MLWPSLDAACSPCPGTLPVRGEPTLDFRMTLGDAHDREASWWEAGQLRGTGGARPRTLELVGFTCPVCTSLPQGSSGLSQPQPRASGLKQL